MSSKPTLTEHLSSESFASSPEYNSAINHPFLESAGSNSLTHLRLALWLGQDRIYAAHAYPRFIGLLIAKIPFHTHDALDSIEERRNQRILKILVYALNNVVREVSFFEEASKKWDLDIEGWEERKGTRDYTAEMMRVASVGSIEHGLVFLWGMEKIYLDSWTYVKGLLDQQQPKDDEAEGPDASASPSATAAAVKSLTANWTNEEFVKFVDDLATVVDNSTADWEAGTTPWKRAEATWKRVIELEENFWPEIGRTGLKRLN